MVSVNIKQIEASLIVVYAAGYLTIVFLSVCLGTAFARLSFSVHPPFPSNTDPIPFILQTSHMVVVRAARWLHAGARCCMRAVFRP